MERRGEEKRREEKRKKEEKRNEEKGREERVLFLNFVWSKRENLRIERTYFSFLLLFFFLFCKRKSA